MNQRANLLATLSFGLVDAESLPDLDRRFLRTNDFDDLVRTDAVMILGPKGSGKSTIFELFNQHEGLAREFAGGALDSVIVATGTGRLDEHELTTTDMETLKGEHGFDHDKMWRLYFAIKGALALRDYDIGPGPVRELLRALGERRDLRVAPLMRALWRALIGHDASASLKVAAFGASLEFTALKDARIEVTDLLRDVQRWLDESRKSIWLLFDKIDELYPSDANERQRAIQTLLATSMSIRRSHPRIRPKVFLRDDIWVTLNFPNKTHLVDKTVRLNWSRRQIAELLIKGAAASPGVETFIRTSFRPFRLHRTHELSLAQLRKASRTLISSTIPYHERRVTSYEWIFQRVRDGHGHASPRDAVYWLNVAAESERKRSGRVSGSDPLITSDTLPSAFSKVSQARRSAFLSEFPALALHLDRFEGQEGPTFTRGQLSQLFSSLEPDPESALRMLAEIGVLTPLRGSVSTADLFEVPILYREGLNLTTNQRV